MKRFLLSIAVLAPALFPDFALAQTDTLEGHWQNGAMEIEIGPCGSKLCGTVTKASEKQQEKAESGSGTQLLGSKIIDNIEPAGPQDWNADIFLASRNTYARGTIEQTGSDQLTVRGCVAFICKTTHWSRSPANVEETPPGG